MHFKFFTGKKPSYKKFFDLKEIALLHPNFYIQDSHMHNNNNTQQINYEMTQQGQIPGGMLQQGHYPEGMPNMVPGYVGYQWGQ